jgi:auxin efflux carrier family protein
MDYIGPDVESEEVKVAIRMKRKAILYGWMRPLSPRIYSRYMSRHGEDDIEVKADEDRNSEDDSTFLRAPQSMTGDKHVSPDDANTGIPSVGILSRVCTPTQTELGVHPLSPVTSPEPTIVAGDTHIMRKTHPRRERSNLQFILPAHNLPSASPHMGPPPGPSPPGRQRLSTTKKILTQGLAFLKSLVNPPSVAIFLSFPIALIPSLKSLFVEVPSVHMSSAPDGLPPLAFFFDTTVFISGASVPLGLICLGSALARLNVPRDREGWRTLPIGAITGIAVGKMILMPVLGVLLVQGLVNGGVLPREDKVLQFVCMCVVFLSLRLF